MSHEPAQCFGAYRLAGPQGPLCERPGGGGAAQGAGGAVDAGQPGGAGGIQRGAARPRCGPRPW